MRFRVGFATGTEHEGHEQLRFEGKLPPEERFAVGPDMTDEEIDAFLGGVSSSSTRIDNEEQK